MKERCLKSIHSLTFKNFPFDINEILYENGLLYNFFVLFRCWLYTVSQIILAFLYC